jgi:hypothetical protein
LRRLVLALPCLLSFSGCLPFAAWSADGYTVDNSRTKDGRAIVGHCYRLLVDANVIEDPEQVNIRHGDAVSVGGYLRLVDRSRSGSAPLSPPSLPKGSTFVVERTLLWRNVEDSSMRPYARVHGELINAAEVFQDGVSSEHRMWHIDRLLEPCDRQPSAN